MRVSEKTISIWAVIALHMDSEFYNPNYSGDFNSLKRLKGVKKVEY